MRAVEPIVAATSFLTRIPVGRSVDAAAVGRAAPLYPLVGAAVGAVAGGVVDLAAGPLPALAGAALGLGVAALLTGAMHIDALADTADALGGMSRERRLEIMRDHAVGAFGVTAVALVLIFEVAVLSAEPHAWSAFAVAAACARWAPLPQAALLPYVRAHGQGEALADTRASAVGIGLAVAVVLALALRGVDGLAAVGAAAVTTLVLGVFFRGWIGGVTGDTLGATTELAQAAALAALLVA